MTKACIPSVKGRMNKLLAISLYSELLAVFFLHGGHWVFFFLKCLKCWSTSSHAQTVNFMTVKWRKKKPLVLSEACKDSDGGISSSYSWRRSNIDKYPKSKRLIEYMLRLNRRWVDEITPGQNRSPSDPIYLLNDRRPPPSENMWNQELFSSRRWRWRWEEMCPYPMCRQSNH